VAGLKKQAAAEEGAAEALATKKSVIIMDEVDGVGAGDRGGIQALIQIIKNTRTPIICICNDRMNKKLQSLIGYCYDLKFQRPSKEAIVKRVKLVCQD
jgi:replication factor C subunit 1